MFFLAATRITSIWPPAPPRSMTWKSRFTSLMSNGMYCSASHRICSASSLSVIAGRLIFLMITECPETDVATSFDLTLWAASRERIVSLIEAASMSAPSMIASPWSGAWPKWTSW